MVPQSEPHLDALRRCVCVSIRDDDVVDDADEAFFPSAYIMWACETFFGTDTAINSNPVVISSSPSVRFIALTVHHIIATGARCAML